MNGDGVAAAVGDPPGGDAVTEGVPSVSSVTEGCALVQASGNTMTQVAKSSDGLLAPL
jgi:hypothetical protein